MPVCPVCGQYEEPMWMDRHICPMRDSGPTVYREPKINIELTKKELKEIIEYLDFFSVHETGKILKKLKEKL